MSGSASLVCSVRLAEFYLQKQISAEDNSTKDKKSLSNLVRYVQKPLESATAGAKERAQYDRGKIVTKSVSNAATARLDQPTVSFSQEKDPSESVDSASLISTLGKLSPAAMIERRKQENEILQLEREENSTKDQIAIERVIKGDVGAFQELVQRYEQKVYRIALAVLGNTEDARDVSQEAFIRVYQKLEGFRGDSSFYTWLYRITFNLSVDLSRKRYRSKELGFAENEDNKFRTSGVRLEGISESSFSASITTPDEALDRSELGRKLDKAMDALSEEHRAVVAMRELDGLSYAEIADAIGISKGTVMSRLHHARKKLQQYLTGAGETK